MTTNVIPFARTAAKDITISSLEIAELTGKRHPDVKRDIRKMLKQLDKSCEQFCSEWRDRTGRLNIMYALDRFHTEVLVTGYDIKRRAAVIQRWYDLEAGEAAPWYQQKAAEPKAALPDFTNPAAAALGRTGDRGRSGGGAEPHSSSLRECRRYTAQG